MARPRKFAEDAVVASAGETFARNGYGGTTIDDLTKATGLGKQSLYNAFGGKRGLFMKALLASTADAIEAVDEALSGPDSTPLERIKAQMLKVAIVLGDDDRQGSLFTKATVELGHRDTDVAASALDGFTRLEGIYRHCIIDAQRSGEIASDADPRALAAYFVAVTRGMEVVATAGVGRAELTAIATTSLAALPLADRTGST
ncbi:TetR/AcrR family transcriptional regulator [Amycolatopsis saalfeldensis]|uniref:DNA-binding transcriptional regulator, AcrR family n=1 Tax=Amycolatopsis saalfeldensis TaxID=394193 RepID=A0A1H8Y4X3_9PSEU|nr:TetR/AcrR family transcriptional regulator [Amycolatopsis saalfeldensis]SEP47304.1 DNA-binding transcriptional regulator, AcrR family [Amycolatopsis saalfeldensis]